MKFFAFAVVCLLSSVSFASGYECSGRYFNVKLYNHTDPARGTSNPAVLIVSGIAGTIMKLDGDKIEKGSTVTDHIYAGRGHLVANGHFASVELAIKKTPSINNGITRAHYGSVQLRAEGMDIEDTLRCDYYLKGNR